MAGRNKVREAAEDFAKPVPRSKAYRIVRPDGYTGNDKFVVFNAGVGILDLEALHAGRPDWVELSGDGFVQVAGIGLDQYVEFWERRGYEIEEITAKEAAEHRSAVAAKNEKAIRDAHAKVKARQRLKTLGLEGATPPEEAEAKAIEKVLNAPARPGFPAKSEPAEPPLPHEQDGIANKNMTSEGAPPEA
jgi:hypothetical protein